jgi:arylsulfatase A-like enzyme
MSSSPSVLFVVLDSARLDRVSVYGHDRETTPVLEDLASTGTRFDNAFTPAPWTLPSHSSMFTGLFPSEHGVTNGFTDRDLGLPSDVDTIAETLSASGYRTAGFSNNPWVGQLSGLNRGFEEFVEWDLEVSASGGAPIHTSRDRFYDRIHTALGHAARQPVFLLKRRFFTERLIERAERWLEHAIDGPQPSFTFLNLMEAHSPYFPPGRAFRELGLDAPGPVEPRLLNTTLLAYTMGQTDLSEAKRRRVLEFYDASLRYEDEMLGELFSLLRSRDVFDDFLVVVCADHGKTLGEFDRDATPSHYLRDVNLNVPLVIKAPGQSEPREVSTPFELVRLHDVITSGHRQPVTTYLPADHRAMAEEHLPHTGTESTDVTRWRIIADPGYKYARSEDGREVVFVRDGLDETVLDVDDTLLRMMRRGLTDREETLDVSTREAGEAETALGDSTEAHLRDLGYLG